jgi:GDPmannose 4,6-dehydratase
MFKEIGAIQKTLYTVCICPCKLLYLMTTFFASGEKHSVREFIEKAFLQKGIKILWKGYGLNEIGIDSLSEKVLVIINQFYFRNNEKTKKKDFCGNYLKALSILGWNKKHSIDEIIEKMG